MYLESVIARTTLPVPLIASVLGVPQPSLCVQVCTVFAQLTVGGKWEGPHVFVVRLRDDNGKLIPGVRIRDNGPKAGLNGVDNGQIWCACMAPTCFTAA